MSGWAFSWGGKRGCEEWLWALPHASSSLRAPKPRQAEEGEYRDGLQPVAYTHSDSLNNQHTCHQKAHIYHPVPPPTTPAPLRPSLSPALSICPCTIRGSWREPRALACSFPHPRVCTHTQSQILMHRQVHIYEHTCTHQHTRTPHTLIGRCMCANMRAQVCVHTG